MKWLLAILAVSGCAKAAGENAIVGGISDAGTRDGGDFPEPDASRIDAPPNQITLSQNAGTKITDLNSFACYDPNADHSTARNTYYRLFQPSRFGVTGTFHVAQVAFGVETADAGTGEIAQPAKVQIGTYGGAIDGDTLDLAQIRVLETQDITIPNGRGFTHTAAIRGDVRPDDQLIVILDVADGGGTREFLIGTNSLGERNNAYLMASLSICQVLVPTSISSVAAKHDFGEVDILMSVTGTF